MLTQGADQILALLAWALLLGIPVGLFRIRRGIRRQGAEGHPLCAQCGYDLFGLAQDRTYCPECGTGIHDIHPIRIGRLEWQFRQVLQGVTVIVVSCLACWGLRLWTQEMRDRPARLAEAIDDLDVAQVDRLLRRLPRIATIMRSNADAQAKWLAAAIGKDSVEVCQRLLDFGVDPNAAQTRDSSTALHQAAAIGDAALVKLVLEHGGDPTAKEKIINATSTDGDGWTPLHFAAKYPTPALIRLLLDEGAQVAAADPRGRTPLHVALEFAGGGFEPARILVDAGASLDAKDSQGRTPLHCATSLGDVAVVRLLLSKGADPNALDAAGQTPIQQADSHFVPSWDAAVALLQAGASLYLADPTDVRPKVSLRHGNSSSGSVPGGVDAATWCQIVETALKGGKADLVDRTIRKDPDALGYRNPALGSLLHIAGREGCPRLGQILLAQGADVHPTAYWNETPLGDVLSGGMDMRQKAGRDPLYDNLICDGFPSASPRQLDHRERGTRPSRRNAPDRSEDYVQFAKLLVAHGAAVDTPDKLKQTPLGMAKTARWPEMIAVLSRTATSQATDLD